MNSQYKAIFSSLIILLFLIGCASKPNDAGSGKVSVTVSILPEKYFVERIGGDKVEVNVMVGPGDSPHTYEPKPEQMAAVSRSEIYFAIGVEFESAWMDRIASANQQMQIIDLSENIEKITSSGHQDNANGIQETNGENHAKDELDPHIWTSPEIAKSLAQKITNELAAIDSTNAAFYQSNLDQLIIEIEVLQDEIHSMLDGMNNRQFLVFHPAWGYFAREFNLEEIAIEVGGTEPSASELGQIIDTAKSEGIRTVFAQPEFSTQIADYIASEIGGKVVLITPLAENWMENIRTVAQSLAEND